MSTGEFTRRLIIAGVFILIGYALYRTADLLLIAFAAIMFAVIFSTAAGGLQKHLRVPRGLALALVVLLLLGAIGGLGYLFGTRISIQAQQLADVLPEGLQRVRALLKTSAFGPKLIGQLQSIDLGAAGGNILSHALGAVGSLLSVISDIVLIFFGAIYLAAQPDLYLRGALSLMPPKLRPRGAEIIAAIYGKLWHWLLGQFISMAVVGTAFGVALALIGVPSSIVLGLIAALLEFIPLIGPMLAAVPALLVAISQGPTTLLWVLAAFLVIQQTEANLLVPYVQKRAVELPPVLALFSTVVFGLLFGVMGLIFAVPLLVTVIIAVQEIYINDILGGAEPASAPELKSLAFINK